MPRFVCLNCDHEWVGEIGSRCWKCHRRIVVEGEAFDEAVEAVREVRRKVASSSEPVNISDVIDAIVKVTNLTGRFRGRPLIVRRVRKKILSAAGVL